ncbi:MAG: hypothetical protein KIC94_14610 [Clostridiales bacterium]|nr:hypothetical protein [Clostridiales bacterium]
MNYKNANEILPTELVREIQKYLKGELLYIPNGESTRKKWGERSGIRKELLHRNQEIKRRYIDGHSFEQLSSDYALSVETVKKIVYTTKLAA